MIDTTGRVRISALAGALLALLAGAPVATAQPLSNRPITIVVPFTPGTGIDILARTIGEQIRQRWGQSVVADNKPGASGNIGTEIAARAAPDGHTLLMTVNTFVMNPSLYKTVPYDPVTSFAPIVEVATGALALAVHPSVPASSTQALIAHAKSQPGKLNYASPGVGTPQHLAMELFKLTTGVNLVHIPYRGSAGAVQDLAAGQVNAMFLPVHTALPLAQGEKIRLLAVGSEKRAPVAPQVPTLVEEGVAGFEVDLWYGLLAPARTPPEIIAKLNAEVRAILELDSVKEVLRSQGLTPVSGTPEAFGRLIAADRDRWAKVVREAGIQPE
jgi:tripartite-type tricarboxylate transporter receptor subunit TctC